MKTAKQKLRQSKIVEISLMILIFFLVTVPTALQIASGYLLIFNIPFFFYSVRLILAFANQISMSNELYFLETKLENLRP